MTGAPDFPVVVDLWSLIETLSDHPLYLEIRDLAMRAQRAQSCSADLTLAQSCCETLEQIDAPDALNPALVTKEAALTIRNALLANAVALYVRATSTHSSGGERGSVSMSGRLSDVDQADHEILLGLRNRAMAHVYAGEAVGEVIWHHEHLIVREDGVPGCVTRRIQMDEATVRRLRRLLPIVSQEVRATFLKRITRLTERFNEANVPVEAMALHPFDAVAFFGGEAEARRALSPPPGGSISGLAR